MKNPTQFVFSEKSPVAIYNVNEQRLIAVFACRATAVKFIYGNAKRGASTISDRIKRKGKIWPQTSQLPFPVAVRTANPIQLQMLGSADFCLLDQGLRHLLPIPGGMKMKEVQFGK